MRRRQCRSLAAAKALLGKDNQVERAVAIRTVGIVGIYPDALVIIKWRPQPHAWAASERHTDLAGGFGGNAGSADGGDISARADVTSEEDLILPLAQPPG